MSNLEKLKRHISPLVPLTFKNERGEEDTFYFKPLNVVQQSRISELSKRFRKYHEVNESPKESDVKETVELLVEIVMDSIEGIDEKTAIDFVNSNFIELFDSLDKLLPSDKEMEKMDLIKKRREEILNAKQKESNK